MTCRDSVRKRKRITIEERQGVAGECWSYSGEKKSRVFISHGTFATRHATFLRPAEGRRKWDVFSRFYRVLSSSCDMFVFKMKLSTSSFQWCKNICNLLPKMCNATLLPEERKMGRK